ncbi:MAG: ribosome assembly RNA-binding protein YhbY [Polyangiaceae bacterium]|nr:ribosome assembly RNA-binding protein YhbY [Polyangiaceae bacterium]
MALDGKQRRFLRALGHPLAPVLQIGRGGATPAVVREVERAVAHHELIKVRVGREAPGELDEIGAALAGALGAELAQVLGRTLLLYRRRARDPVIQLPGAPPIPAKRARAPGASKRLPSTRAAAPATRDPRPAPPAKRAKAGSTAQPASRWRGRRAPEAPPLPDDEDDER